MLQYDSPGMREGLISPALKKNSGVVSGKSSFGMELVKILIVENDFLVASDIKATLEEVGHEVIGIAREHREALKLIKNDPPDLALINMTLGNSEDGGIKIAADILLQHWIPIIYLTAFPDPEMIEKASATQPSAYLFKPFRPDEMLIQIRVAHENFSNRFSAGLKPAGSENFYFPSRNGHERVKVNEILFLKAQGHCTDVFLTGSKNPHMIGTNLGTLVKYFTTDNFMRLSKSLFINLDHLKQIGRNHIFLGEEKLSIEISEANRKELLKKLQIIRTK